MGIEEEKFRLIVESIKDYAIFMLDPQGRVLSWNEGARRIKGYEPSEIIGKHFSLFYPEEDKLTKPPMELEVAAQIGRFEDEDWRIRKDGSRFWANVVITALRDGQGKLVGYAKVTRDLTDRKRREIERLEEQRRELAFEQIRKSQLAIENERENFRSLFRQTPEIICILRGPDHVFEFVNEAHIKTLGFDATGKSVRQAQPESVEVHGILDEVYRTGKTISLHEIPITVGDRVRYFDSTYSAQRNQEGIVDGVMILGMEISEQVRIRETLRSSEDRLVKAVQARDEFMSMASHELKTPLTSLKLQAQIRKRNLQKGNLAPYAPERLLRLVIDDEKQINRLIRLVDDMLDIARLSSGRLKLAQEHFDLCEMVREVVERFRPQLLNDGIELDIECVEPVFGTWDRFRIEQVFINLLTNAMKYGKGAPITVSVSSMGDIARLSVRDRGIGIAQADQQRIFSQFERAVSTNAVSGLGLGLYIAKELVVSHGGRIHLESALGEGAEFVVELPQQSSQGRGGLTVGDLSQRGKKGMSG